jgi:hypothetical protein
MGVWVLRTMTLGYMAGNGEDLTTVFTLLVLIDLVFIILCCSDIKVIWKGNKE